MASPIAPAAALRIVDANGTRIYPVGSPGYHRLDAGGLATRDRGLWLADTDVTYAQELIGPWTNVALTTRLRLVGYRVSVALRFVAVDAHSGLDAFSGGYGLSLLRRYHRRSFEQLDRAALEFNLYVDNPSSVWRGVWVKSVWHPRKIEAKFTGRRVAVDLDLETADVIDEPGDWSQRLW